jgi:hypothetical protein
MKSKQVFVIVGALSIGLRSQMAMAMGEDTTNEYFDTSKAAGSCPVTLEGSRSVERTVVIEKTGSSPAVIERTVSTPVVIDRALTGKVLVEDRIVKQKHWFSFGIWPLFDFEIL